MSSSLALQRVRFCQLCYRSTERSNVRFCSLHNNKINPAGYRRAKRIETRFLDVLNAINAELLAIGEFGASYYYDSISFEQLEETCTDPALQRERNIRFVAYNIACANEKSRRSLIELAKLQKSEFAEGNKLGTLKQFADAQQVKFQSIGKKLKLGGSVDLSRPELLQWWPLNTFRRVEFGNALY